MQKKKLKVGVVGYGFISAKGHIPAYLKRDDVEVVAVADVCLERRVLAQKELPSARVFSSHVELLASGIELDIIDISTPPCDHKQIALDAFARGLHVLCEKPLTVDMKSAQEMLLAAKRAGRVIFPCHNYKHAPVVKTINDAISSGKLGEITGVTLQTFRNTHAKGVKEWNTDWRRENRYSGGGIAMDHGSHTFYLTFAWLNSLPLNLNARSVTLNRQWDTEDNLTVSLEFPGKKFAHCNLSWTAGIRKVVYTVQGTHGAVVVNDDDAEISIGFPNTGSHTGTSDYHVEKKVIESDWMDASHTKWFNSMFDKFVTCIEADDFLNSEIRESYMCIQIIENCYRSSREKSAVVDLDSSFSFLS